MKTTLLAAITAVLSLASPIVRGASDYLLQIDGIKGESEDAAYPEAIHIESFSWGCTNQGTFAGAGNGGLAFTGLEIAAKVSAASPQLLVACATGQHFAKAVIHVRKEGTLQEYLTITLSDVHVTSWSNRATPPAETAVATADDRPTESLSINFTKIEYKYIPYDSSHAPVTGTAQLAPR